MTAVIFRTPGTLPLDAFTTFGVNVKPNTKSPFGYFGTGLKYAVAVILRHGGTFRVFIKGTEYEFYLHTKDFRGKDFQQVRMRKRKWGMSRWLKSDALPFTTELGKNWELWQAFRELESNTRDENGVTDILSWNSQNEAVHKHGDRYFPQTNGTDILVECDGFYESTMTHERAYQGTVVHSQVFLQPEGREVVFESDRVVAYAGASDHIYYQGIRVYDLRNPSRLTYDFKPGQVQLSEDRSAKNIWDMQYWLSKDIQELQDETVINKLLRKDPGLWFETDDLTFYGSGGRPFQTIAAAIASGGNAARSVSGWFGSYGSPAPARASTSITFFNEDWVKIIDALKDSASEDVKALGRQIAIKIGDDVPF